LRYYPFWSLFVLICHGWFCSGCLWLFWRAWWWCVVYCWWWWSDSQVYIFTLFLLFTLSVSVLFFFPFPLLIFLQFIDSIDALWCSLDDLSLDFWLFLSQKLVLQRQRKNEVISNFWLIVESVKIKPFWWNLKKWWSCKTGEGACFCSCFSSFLFFVLFYY
jgi:hypothetical protein